jgi:hypothetical protein
LDLPGVRRGSLQTAAGYRAISAHADCQGSCGHCGAWILRRKILLTGGKTGQMKTLIRWGWQRLQAGRADWWGSAEVCLRPKVP